MNDEIRECEIKEKSGRKSEGKIRAKSRSKARQHLLLTFDPLEREIVKKNV